MKTDQQRTFASSRRKLVASLASLASLIAVALPAAPAQAGNGRAGPTAELQRALDAVVAAGAPGAVVLVRVDDRTTRLSSGYGNLAPQTPIGVRHRTRIGSVTKSFTATVVLQLAAERRIALGDTVERWLPGVISNGEDISIRQLLNHTSGIFDYVQDPTILAPYLGGDLTQVFDPRRGVQVAAEHGPLFAPGSAFRRRCAGKSGDAKGSRRGVLRPLGMSS